MTVTSLSEILSNLNSKIDSAFNLVLNDAALGTSSWLDPRLASAIGGPPSLSAVSINASAASLMVLGNATLLGARTRLTIIITWSAGAPQVHFFAPLPADWRFSTSFPAVAGTEFDKLATTGSQLVFSTYAYYDTTLDCPIQPGLNYVCGGEYGLVSAGAGNSTLTLRVPTGQLLPQGLLGVDIVSAVVGSLDAMQFSLFVDQNQTPPTTGVALSPLTASISAGPLTWQNVRLFYFRSMVGMSITASLTVGGSVLDFAVSADLSKSLLALSLVLLGVRSPGAPLSSATGQSVLWDRPFGLPGITVRELALGIDLTKKGTAVLGLGGQFSIGNPQSGGCIMDLAAGINTVNEPQYIAGSLHAGSAPDSGLTLSSMLRTLAPGLPLGTAGTILDELKLQQLTAYLVAPGVSIPSPLDPTLVYPSGATLSARVSLFGIAAMMALSFDPQKGVKAAARCDKFQLGPLSLTDATGTQGPRLSIDTTGSLASNIISVTGKLSLFNVSIASAELTAGLPAAGLSFAVQVRGLAGLADFTLSAALGPAGLSIPAAGVTLTLPSVNIPVSVGGVHFFDVTLDTATVSASLSAQVTRTTQSLSLTGSVSAAGIPCSFHFTPAQAVSDLTQLPTLLVEYLISNAQTIFGALLGDLNRLISWAQQGIISLTNTSARVFQSLYGQSVGQAAALLNQAGMLAGDALPCLVDAYGQSLTEVGWTLKGAGYVAADVGSAIQQGFGISEMVTSSALNFAGYAANEVLGTLVSPSQTLQTVQSLTSWAQNNLIVDPANIQGRISAASQVAANAAAVGLNAAGVGLETAGRAIGDSLGKQFVLPAIAAVFQVGDVASYAKNVLNLPADQLASFFKSGLNLGGDQVESLLKGVGYTGDQVSNALGTVYDWGSNNLNPSHW